MPLLLGTLVHEEPAPPEHWKAALRLLSASVREAVELRWKELAATEIVLGEMAEAFGADCCHQRLRAALDAVRGKLIDLYEAVIPFAGSFSLPEPDDRLVNSTRGHVDWDALKSPEQAGANATTQDRRAWLSQNERAVLEEIEARWKDEAQSLTPLREVTKDVPALPLGRRRSKQRRPY